MLKNYIKIAFRNLIKNKVFTFINVFGLAVAFASAFYILIYVVNEFSYDDHNIKKDRIYRTISHNKYFDSYIPEAPYMLPNFIKENFHEVEKVAKIDRIWRAKIIIGEKEFPERNIVSAEQSIFDVLTLPIMKGKADISNLNSIVISEETAKKYFGNNNPINKMIQISVSGKKYDLVVKGVMKNIPATTTFRANILCNIDLSIKIIFKDDESFETNKWKQTIWQNYVLFKNNPDIENIQSKLNSIIKEAAFDDHITYSFEKLKDIYFGGIANTNPQGNINNVYLYLIIGLVILFIAASNYIILSSALSDNRYKEIGVRKLSGATKKNIIYQILGESLIVVFFSLIFSGVIIEMTHTLAQELFNYNFDFHHNNITQYIIGFTIVALFVAVVSSLYLSMYLSSIQVVNIFKDRIFNRNKGKIRRMIVLSELIIFLILIFSVVTLKKQYIFLLDNDMGFNKNNLLIVNYNSNEFSHASSFVEEIINNPLIESACLSNSLPPSNSSTRWLVSKFDNPETKTNIEGVSVGKGFLKTMGVKLLQGEDITQTLGSKNNILINESAIKALGIKDPIGKQILNKNVAGIIKDFNLHSLRSKTSPMFIELGNEEIFYLILIRYKNDNFAEALNFLETKWESISSGIPFKYESMETKTANVYEREKTLQNIIIFFTILAIIIGASGFFGLTLFTLKRRTKEIGIRRVLGATSQNLIYVLSREFLILIGIASIISFPIGYYFMNKWLQNFAYRANIGALSFALTFIIVFMIVGFSISLLVMKSVRTNPVKSLKDE